MKGDDAKKKRASNLSRHKWMDRLVHPLVIYFRVNLVRVEPLLGFGLTT